MNFSKIAFIVLATALTCSAYSQETESETTGGSDIGSAFANDGILYVTVLGDCNTMSGELEVAPTCLQDRVTRSLRNLSPVCSAKLHIRATEIACGNMKEAHVIKVDLKEAKVAQEAQFLMLTLQGFSNQVLEIRLK